MLAIIMIINIVGVEFYGRAESSITIIMMLIYVIMGICGAAGMGPNEVIESQRGLVPASGWEGVFGAVGTGIWFFIGFEFACPMAEENKKPYKYIPWGLILGLISIYIVDIIFIKGVVAYGDLEVIGASDLPQITAATYTLGRFGEVTMSVITFCAGFTTCNAYIASLPRMLYGLAKQGLVPNVFQKIHPQYRVPIPGIIFTAAIILACLVYLIMEGGSAEQVTTFINCACICWLVMYIIAMLDVLVLRKRYPEFPRLWKAPIAWISMPIGIIGSLYAIYTMTYVLLAACGLMAAVAHYEFIWNKTHGLPVNHVPTLQEMTKQIMDRSEPLPVWDEAVEEWIKETEPELYA